MVMETYMQVRKLIEKEDSEEAILILAEEIDKIKETIKEIEREKK